MSDLKSWSLNRRIFIGGGITAFTVLAGLNTCSVMGEESKSMIDKEGSQKKLARGKTRVKGFSSEEMDFQLLRSMGSDVYGGSAIGECLYLVTKIKDGDPASWTQE
jgi:hypothetical protein